MSVFERIAILGAAYLIQVALLLDVEWGDAIRSFLLARGRDGERICWWKEPRRKGELYWKWLWPFILGIVPLVPTIVYFIVIAEKKCGEPVSSGGKAGIDLPATDCGFGRKGTTRREEFRLGCNARSLDNQV